MASDRSGPSGRRRRRAIRFRATDSAAAVSRARKISLGIDLGDDGELPATLGAGVRDGLRVFDAVRSTVLTGGGRFATPLDILIDSSALSRDGHKLGLGSSAAVASALTLGLRKAAALPTDPDILSHAAIAAHRLAQGGTGSGGDVAASVHGGFLRFVPDAEPTALAWPSEVQIMTVLTGAGASTTDLVGRVRAYAAAEPARFAADLARLRKLAEHAHHALSFPSRLLRLASGLLRGACRARRARPGGHRHRDPPPAARGRRPGGRRVQNLGAGGDDVGLAFAHRGEAAERLAAALTDAGAEIIPLSYGEAGVREDGQ